MPEKFYFKRAADAPWQIWPLDSGYFPSPNELKAASAQKKGEPFFIVNPIGGVFVYIYAVAVLGEKKRLTWSLDGKMSPEDTPYGS